MNLLCVYVCMCVCVCVCTHTRVCTLVAQSCPTLCNPMDYIAHQAPMSMEFFSKQEYWSEYLFPSSGDLSNLGSKPSLLH